ncbi:hypothetical protein [uncultured Methanobrevibacter sp.]|uniref:hypothetical protein n=1 Tax=uncultured Methanobrevibacter sp. TaxID=253161 RepID=UPI0025EA627C|nr:hypothetical protein [uncultured Methanobrevibacter sp.]
MEAITTIILIALVIILGAICFWQRMIIKVLSGICSEWQRMIIKVNRQNADTIQGKIRKLQDKYSIPDEEIRACFYPDHQ